MGAHEVGALYQCFIPLGSNPALPSSDHDQTRREIESDPRSREGERHYYLDIISTELELVRASVGINETEREKTKKIY